MIKFFNEELVDDDGRDICSSYFNIKIEVFWWFKVSELEEVGRVVESENDV